MLARCGIFWRAMYSEMTDRGALRQDPAKYDGNQRCPSHRNFEVWRGELFSQDAGRHALWAVHEDRYLHSGLILDKQRHMVFHDVELGEGCATSPRRFPTWVS